MFSRTKNLISYQTPLETIQLQEVGGKAWNLFYLRKFGYPVPAWCVVSSGVFKRTLSAQWSAIHEILSGLDFTHQCAIEAAESRIKELVFHADLSDQISEELQMTLAAIFPEQSFLSVRSSVIGEDSADHSFAGQMDSFLNVPKTMVQKAIWKVWASAFSTRALVYRNRKGICLTDISTAVVIQKMVQAVAAGVLFTQEPEGREKRCVISAGYGLGEGVVTNTVESDSYKIDWDGNDISRDVSVKDWRIVLSANGQGGNRKEPVPGEMRTQQVLTESQIQRLRDVGVKAEKDFGAPQDVEWTFDESGGLFILQTRPIIFGSSTRFPSGVRIWDNSNIVESYPGLTLPLTFTFVRNAYESSFRNTALSFLFFKKGVQKRLHIFKNMIGLLEGRVYYNLLTWYEMLSYLPGFKRHKVAWDQMIGITQRLEFPRSQLSPFNNIYALFVAGWRLLTLKRTASRFFIHFDPIYSRFKDVNMSLASEDELIGVYQSFTHEIAEKWHLTLHNDFCAMTYYGWLKGLCDRWGLARYLNLHNDLLCGGTSVESVSPVHSLVQLAEMFRAEALHRSLMDQQDNLAVWTRIQIEPALASLKDALAIHLKMFGDRTLEELKLETPRLQDRPEWLVGMIRDYFHLGISVETMERREQEIRQKAEKFVRQNLKNIFKRLLFNFVLGNVRTAIASRENMRFARSRVFGVVKRVFNRVGELLTEKGIIEFSSDIFYLTVEEVLSLVEGTAVTQNLKALIEIRKRDYSEFARRTPKERIETAGIPYLSPLCGGTSDIRSRKSARGIGCSSGIAEGTARVISDPRNQNGNGNQILVAKSTDPGWVFLMVSSKGIVVEKGSVLSHTAIIGRELGIPTIVGVKNATELIPDGVKLSINGSTGEARWQ